MSCTTLKHREDAEWRRDRLRCKAMHANIQGPVEPDLLPDYLCSLPKSLHAHSPPFPNPDPDNPILVMCDAER